MGRCSITPDNGGLVLKTPYEPLLVADLKASIPTSERKFDAALKVWIVTPVHAATLQRLVQTYFGEFVMVPQMVVAAKKETRLLDVRYLGQCKQREDGKSTAFGYVGGEWAVIFPERAIRAWFEAGPAPVEAPTQASTLYAVLGVGRAATGDEVKAAFRRMARQWHPDVCKEPNAHEMFIRLKEASDILSDPRKRARYDAGLVLEATLKKPVVPPVTQYQAGGYQSPLRCGWIMAEGSETLGRFVVDTIMAWEDIVSNGKVLVSSWPMGAKAPVEMWV